MTKPETCEWGNVINSLQFHFQDPFNVSQHVRILYDTWQFIPPLSQSSSLGFWWAHCFTERTLSPIEIWHHEGLGSFPPSLTDRQKNYHKKEISLPCHDSAPHLSSCRIRLNRNYFAYQSGEKKWGGEMKNKKKISFAFITSHKNSRFTWSLRQRRSFQRFSFSDFSRCDRY